MLGEVYQNSQTAEERFVQEAAKPRLGVVEPFWR